MYWCQTVACTYKFFLDWQTLIAGVLAFFAAVIALRPIFRQLRLTQIQLEVMSREVSLDRVEKTERRRILVQDELRSITDNFLTEIYRNDPEGEPQINEYWASDAEFTVGEVIEKLQRQQVSRSDTQLIDDRRAVVIQKAEALKECLDDIHRPDSTYFDDPEYGRSDEQIRTLKDDLDRKADVAKGSLDTRIRELETSAKELDQAFDASLSQCRIRIRQINELVLNNR